MRIVHDILAHAIEQLVGSTEIDLRRAGEIMVAADARGHLTGGAATAIAEAVQQNRVTGEVLVQEVALRIHQLVHAHPRAVGIRGREVRENTRAIDALPHERVVRELGGVVPRDLLREEPFVPGTAGDLRPCAGVAEAVRQPYALGLHTEMFLEVTSGAPAGELTQPKAVWLMALG